MDGKAPASPAKRNRSLPRWALPVLLAVILMVLGSLRWAWFMLEEDMILAAAVGNAERVQTLLSLHVDPNATTEDGSSALLFAAGNSRRQVVELLLAHGADPLLRNHDGESPLDVAQESEIKNILKAALSKR